MDQGFNEQKFRELVLYFARKCVDDPGFGVTKLNKLLFYADFLAYANWGQSITGSEYVALDHGPVPEDAKAIRSRMEQQKQIAIEPRGWQQRVVALQEPDIEQFSSRDIAVADRVCGLLEKYNATQVSELSHAFLGWRAAYAETQATGRQVRIPYSTVFVSNEPLDEFETARIQMLAKQHEWTI
jgi:uncharacterized phage-associated protein